MDFGMRSSRMLIRRLWKVSIPFGIVNSGVYLVAAVQIPLVGSILGPAAVAPYYLAARITQTFSAAVQQITWTQMPLFTQQLAAGWLREAKHRMARTTLLGAALYVAASLFLYFGSPSLVKIWVGPGQYVERSVLLLITINFLVGGVTITPGHFVLASGRNPFAASTMIQGVLTIAGVFVLCPRYGLMGVPVSSLLAGLLTNYWYNPFKGWQVWQHINANAGNAAPESPNLVPINDNNRA
jgi:O-antigen/teichoic acid export membrane protein